MAHLHPLPDVIIITIIIIKIIITIIIITIIIITTTIIITITIIIIIITIIIMVVYKLVVVVVFPWWWCLLRFPLPLSKPRHLPLVSHMRDAIGHFNISALCCSLRDFLFSWHRLVFHLLILCGGLGVHL